MQTLSPRQLFQSAVSAEQSGDIARAKHFYQWVTLCVPEDATATLRLGLLALREGSDAASALFAQVLIRKPNNWIALASYAEFLAQGDNHHATVNALKKLPLINPDRAELWQHLATALGRIEASSDGLMAMRRSLTLDPGNDFLQSRYGFLLREERRISPALTAMKRALLLQPGNDDYVFNFAITAPLAGAAALALPWLRAHLTMVPLSANSYQLLSRFLRRHGNKIAAAKSARQALILDPQSSIAHDELAALFRHQASPAEIQLHRWTLARYPENLGALSRLGQLYEESGALLQAAKLTLKAHRLADNQDPLTLRLRRLNADPEAAQLLAGVKLTTKYQDWIAAYEGADARPLNADVKTARKQPLISIILPVHDPDPVFLSQAIKSVQQQSYPNWQLCICDDASRDPEVIALLDQAATADPRIHLTRRLQNGHISRASNDALKYATGEFVTFLDHDDMLATDALSWVVAAIHAHPQVKLIYSDEDKIDPSGDRFGPHFKPDWSPYLLLNQNYICHLAVYDRQLVNAVNGLRVGYEGSQDHDLVLRISREITADQIHHIPRILYHWRAAVGSTAFELAAKPYTLAAGQRAVADHLQQSGIASEVVVETPRLRIKLLLPDRLPKVTIIVPTRDQAALTGKCLKMLLRETDYDPFDLIIVDNDSVEPATFQLFEALTSDPRVRVLPVSGSFNFSALNNQAVATDNSEILCFLNNDCEPLHPEWLTELVALAIQPDIGLAGAKLLYPDDTIQHAGLHLVGDKVAHHSFVGIGRAEGSYMGRLHCLRDVAAVTGACMVMRRDVFDAIGGFNAIDFPIDYSDVDLCLRVLERDLRIVWTPHSILTHHESASRGRFMTVAKEAALREATAAMHKRHRAVLYHDPYYSPNLSIERADHELAFPPRLR